MDQGKRNGSVASALASVVAGLLLCAPAVAQGPAVADCQVPIEYVHDNSPLPSLEAALRAPETTRIVAIGSASMAGMGASAPAKSYAERFLATFQDRMQHAATLDNKAARSMSVSDWLPRIEREVMAGKPALVLWEAGTVDAVRGVDTVEFARMLSEGVHLMKQAGADVLLIDPLFSKRTTTMLNLRPYIDAMKAVAIAENLVFFDRLEIMKFWFESGYFKFADKPDAAMMAENDRIFDCLGRLLTVTVERSVKLKAR
ncbi:MAG: SGNH/GDSL hydrolase family protein [Elsteraceae bacterium]